MTERLHTKASARVVERILRWAVGLMEFFGLTPTFLYFANRWRIRRSHDQRTVFPFITRRKGFHYQILLYHRIKDGEASLFGSTSISVFSRQMAMLSRHFRVFPLEELVQRAASKDVPPRAIAITFDDGYRDNYQNAFPILKQLSLPATIFLATGPLDSNRPLWHDRVFDALERTRAEWVSIDGERYPLRTLSDRRAALNAFRRYLRGHTLRDWDLWIERLLSELGTLHEGHLHSEKLRWQEVEEMSKDGITFGAHTVTHPILTRMPLDQAAEEIRISKEAIEKRLGTPVRLFAYPNGGRDDFDESIKQLLKKTGFLCAVTTLGGTNDAGTDPYELKRLGAWEGDPLVFASRLGWQKFSSE